MATAKCDAWYFDTKTSLTNVTLSNVDTTNVNNLFVTIQAENTDSDSTLVTATSAEIGTLNISDGKLYFDWTDGKAGTQGRLFVTNKNFRITHSFSTPRCDHH